MRMVPLEETQPIFGGTGSCPSVPYRLWIERTGGSSSLQG